MKGRRLPIKVNPTTERPDINLCLPSEPGDYVGPVMGYTGDKPAVFYVLPNHPAGSTPAHVTSPPHSFTEEDDGSLSITASIEHKGEIYYHGWLTRGEWSDA